MRTAIRWAWSTGQLRLCVLGLSVLTSPRLVDSWSRPNRQFLSRPIRELTKADSATGLFVFGNLVLILAPFLHVVAVAGLDPIGAVDLFPHGTLLCQGINDTVVICSEHGLPLEELKRISIGITRGRVKGVKGECILTRALSFMFLFPFLSERVSSFLVESADPSDMGEMSDSESSPCSLVSM